MAAGLLATAGRLLACLLLAACAAATTPPEPGPLSGDVVYVLDHGWHTDLGLPAAELRGQLAVFRSIYPGARSFVFSYGKRTFITAPPDDWAEYILGPVPGPAAILVTGLSVPPDAAYRGEQVAVLRMPAGGARALSAYLWGEFVKDGSGRPKLRNTAPFPGGLFYDATRTYTLFHTCNAWTADGLRAAGLPVSPDGVVFAQQVMRRAREAAAAQRQGGGEPSEQTTEVP